MTERGDWVGYYEEQGEREPRDVLMQALAMFEDEGRRGLAVALGCGHRPSGRFAGELFGDRDTWASTEDDMTFFDIGSARALFDGMEIESFVEEENDHEGWSEMKHWHVFHVIAGR